MILNRVTGNCPKCGAIKSFGNVFVANNLLLKGCVSCNYQIKSALPRIRKKVLYLDQCFYSALFNGQDPRIDELGKKISKLAHAQQLVTPISSIHEIESLQRKPPNGDGLYEFIKKTSRGHKFNLPLEVKTHQFHRSFRSFRNKDDFDIELMKSDAVPDGIHDWDDYQRINLKFSVEVENTEVTRALKQKSAKQLVALFPEWKQQDKSFSDLFQIEAQGAVDALLSLYCHSVERLQSLDPSAFVGSTELGDMMMQFVAFVKRETGEDNALEIAVEYLRSEYFYNLPHIFIYPTLHAKLRQKVQLGDHANREEEKMVKKFRGFHFDAEFISVFGAYCDAIFVDKAMRHYLEDKDINLSAKYGAKIFSASNLEDMGNWLDEIDVGISDGMRQVIAEVYP